MLKNTKNTMRTELLATRRSYAVTSELTGFEEVATNCTQHGSMSFENVFMISGVTVNKDVREEPITLYIEDAIQETAVATGGV